MGDRPLELHITEAGDGNPLIFIHGLDSDSTVWEPAVQLLTVDHRCLTVDLPGHGESPKPDDPAAYHRESVLADIDAIISRLDAPAMIVGHSLGGYLALAHAITRPGDLAGLVLVSTGPGFRDDLARADWNDRVAANTDKYKVSAVAAGIANHIDSLVIDRLGEIDLPVALVIGGDDRAFLGANDYLEKKLRHVRRTTVPGARHYVMKSNPETIAAAVRSLATEPG